MTEAEVFIQVLLGASGALLTSYLFPSLPSFVPHASQAGLRDVKLKAPPLSSCLSCSDLKEICSSLERPSFIPLDLPGSSLFIVGLLVGFALGPILDFIVIVRQYWSRLVRSGLAWALSSTSGIPNVRDANSTPS